MQELHYSVLDVFAEQPLTGNQLAVFHDGRGLDTDAMQAIAREMNLSETTFVLPRPVSVEAEHGVRVRIFTTEEELPFAGHPTLGTATWLRLHHPVLRGGRHIALELDVGTIPVEFQQDTPGRPGSFATMRQNDPQFLLRDPATWPTDHEIAEALGLSAADLGFHKAHEAAIETVTTGNPFCLVPLRDLEALGRLSLSAARARPLLRRAGARFFYCLAPTGSAETPWRGRMQFGGGEDPATGSAAGCVAAWLVQHRLAQSGEPVLLEQGIEMLRPSRLTLCATRTDVGRITDVFVGGRTVLVAAGRLFRP